MQLLFRALLHLYPRAFRREYGELMQQAFRDQLRTNPGGLGRIKLALTTLCDVVGSVSAMRFDGDASGSARTWLVFLSLAGATDLFSVWAHSYFPGREGDVLANLSLLPAGFLVGFVDSRCGARRAFRWAVLLMLTMSLSNWGFGLSSGTNPSFVMPYLGAYGTVLLRKRRNPELVAQLDELPPILISLDLNEVRTDKR